MTNDPNLIERFSNIFQRKNQADDSGGRMNDEDLNQLAGHVTQGSNEADFEYLQKNRNKRLAWVFGGDGLKLFLKQSNIEILRSVGWQERGIRKKLEKGGRFRLGVFYRSDQRVPATWDGIFSLIDQHYPKSISSKILQHIDALKSMTFDEIEARARLSYLQGAAYFQVNDLPSNGFFNDPRFMTEERFSLCEGTLEQSRGFLYNAVGLTRLYDGSGFTKDSTGKLHIREYLQLNLPVRDLPRFRYLDLSFDINDLLPDA